MNCWEQVKEILSRKISPPSYRRWLAGTSLKRTEGSSLVIAVPDEVTKQWIEYEFADDIRTAIGELDLPYRQVTGEVSAAEEEGFLISNMATKEVTPVETYDSNSIKVLEGLEAVRLRPSMYIGSITESGLHHLVYEVVDNSVDEALAGYCDHIEVTVHSDNSVTVVDNGRGIPIDIKEEFGISAAEVVMTKLHAGGKFDSNSYKVSGGLHGVGVSCVNALSEALHLEIWREGGTFEQDYAKGIPKGRLEKTGKAGRKTGTKITFKPDSSIMDATKFNFDTLAQRLRQLAFLNKGLRIVLTDEREDPARTETFHFEGGIAEFIKLLNKGKSVLHEKPIHFEGDRELPGGGTLT